MVVPSQDAVRWMAAVEELLDDPARLERMSHAAAQRAQRATLGRTFESFWSAHLSACEKASEPTNDVPTIAHSAAT